MNTEYNLITTDVKLTTAILKRLLNKFYSVMSPMSGNSVMMNDGTAVLLYHYKFEDS